MRIMVSGTHASGKSTLISDFALRHPEFAVLPDPFESLDETDDSPSSGIFAAQLRVAAQRLADYTAGDDIISERGPIDFLAYLLTTAELTGVALDDEVLERATRMTTAAMMHVDLLVVLPLTAHDGIYVGDDEYLELRAAMDAVLRELVEDSDVVGDLVAVEIAGDPDARRAAREELVRGAVRDPLRLWVPRAPRPARKARRQEVRVRTRQPGGMALSRCRCRRTRFGARWNAHER